MNLQSNTWRYRLHEVIFESNISAGKTFDICLLISILVSITVVMLDSVASLHLRYSKIFFIIEWPFTILFTIEYLLRLISVRKPWRYVFSFLGLVDLLAIIPMYLSILEKKVMMKTLYSASTVAVARSCERQDRNLLIDKKRL